MMCGINNTKTGREKTDVCGCKVLLQHGEVEYVTVDYDKLNTKAITEKGKKSEFIFYLFLVLLCLCFVTRFTM